VIEFAIVSGKGGTGKTTLTASFAVLAENKVIADCDVDAPDLHLLLKPEIKQKSEFHGMKRAYIRKDECIECGICRDKCRFDAISEDYVVDPISCEGCEVCSYACPVKAIEMRDTVSGYWFVSDTPYGSMVHGILEIGEENSGKLVTVIRKQALFLAQKQNVNYLIVDGPPGAGCPVNSTLSGLKYTVIVTEPTQSGLHDLERIVNLAHHFNVRPFIVINKYDINKEVSLRIKKGLDEIRANFLGSIPFDRTVNDALKMGKPVVEFAPESEASLAVKEIWERFKKSVLS